MVDPRGGNPRNPHWRRQNAHSGCPGLDLGSEPADHPDPWVSNGQTDKRKHRCTSIWTAESRSGSRDCWLTSSLRKLTARTQRNDRPSILLMFVISAFFSGDCA